MTTTHKTIVHARCPKGCWDYYEVEVVTERTILVEDIEGIADGLRGETQTQEDFTARFAEAVREYDFDAKVIVRGRHGQNTDTVVEL